MSIADVDKADAAAPTNHPRRQKWELTDQESPDEVLKRFETRDNQMFPDDPNNAKHTSVMQIKEKSKYYDPCKLSAQMSLNCLERSRYKSKRARVECKEYFEAYKECKAEWMASLRNSNAWDK
ncbi:hypothetical protein V1512DRAFT_265906 [Lipomyces arxii]|uniref:uncharacterized protein n=1 Tax=Lipomyces arxii TaxID=56418 RepID=UPI0034CEBD59